MSVFIGMVLAIAMMIFVFFIMFKVDWEKYLDRYLSQLEEKEKKLGQQNVG